MAENTKIGWAASAAARSGEFQIQINNVLDEVRNHECQGHYCQQCTILSKAGVVHFEKEMKR